MFLLDTNVVSQFRLARTGRADPKVIHWAATQAPEAMFLSSVTLFEIDLGVRLMERRDARHGAALRNWITTFLMPEFSARILSVDADVAQVAAGLHNPAPFADSLIAATALVHGLIVATRNARDFAFPGVRVLNTWE